MRTAFHAVCVVLHLGGGTLLTTFYIPEEIHFMNVSWLAAPVSPGLGFVGCATIASVVVLVIAGVIAAVNESVVVSYVMGFVLALPFAVVLAVFVAVAANRVRQILPALTVAPTVGLASSGVRGPPTPVPSATAPRALVRAATFVVPDPAPGGTPPRARAVQNSAGTRNVRRGWEIGAHRPSGSVSSPHQTSGPHAQDPTILPVRPPTSRDQQPPLPPVVAPAESPVVAPPVRLTQLAESSSILLDLFSQGSHVLASVFTIPARIRRGGENMVPEADCIICYAESADTVFMPCKHLVVCAVCISCTTRWLGSCANAIAGVL